MWEAFCFSGLFLLSIYNHNWASWKKKIPKTIWVRERKHCCGASPKSRPPAHTQLDIAVIRGKSLNGRNYKWNYCWQGEEAQLYLTEAFSSESCFLFSFFLFFFFSCLVGGGCEGSSCLRQRMGGFPKAFNVRLMLWRQRGDKWVPTVISTSCSPSPLLHLPLLRSLAPWRSPSGPATVLSSFSQRLRHHSWKFLHQNSLIFSAITSITPFFSDNDRNETGKIKSSD